MFAQCKILISVVALACLGGAGCGESSCEEAGRLICEKACACGKDKCAIGGGAGSFAFDDLKACTDLYVGLGCAGGGDSQIDHSGCSNAMSSAKCVARPEREVLEMPAACNPPDDGAP